MKNNSLHLPQDKQKKNSLTMGNPTSKTKSQSKMKWLNKWLKHYSSESRRNKKKLKNSLNYKDLKKKRNVKKKKQKQKKNV